MTDQKIIKLEKEIQKKLTIPEKKNTHKGLDVTRAKQLAKRLNTIELQSPHATAI